MKREKEIERKGKTYVLVGDALEGTTCLPAKRPWATYESVLLVFLCFAEFLKCRLYQLVVLLGAIVEGVGELSHSLYTNYNYIGENQFENILYLRGHKGAHSFTLMYIHTFAVIFF